MSLLLICSFFCLLVLVSTAFIPKHAHQKIEPSSIRKHLRLLLELGKKLKLKKKHRNFVDLFKGFVRNFGLIGLMILLHAFFYIKAKHMPHPVALLRPLSNTMTTIFIYLFCFLSIIDSLFFLGIFLSQSFSDPEFFSFLLFLFPLDPFVFPQSFVSMRNKMNNKDEFEILVDLSYFQFAFFLSAFSRLPNVRVTQGTSRGMSYNPKNVPIFYSLFQTTSFRKKKIFCPWVLKSFSDRIPDKENFLGKRKKKK